MKKRALFLITLTLIIFNFSLISSAVDLGIRPSTINLNLFLNEENCTDITIFTAYKNINVTAEDKWADDLYTTDINDFTKSHENLNLKITYAQILSIKKQAEDKLCITADKIGKYNGMLTYKYQENEKIKVISWIKLNVAERDAIKIKSGNSNTKNDVDLEVYILPLLFSTLVFIIIIIYLNSANKKIKKQRAEKAEQLNIKNL